MFTIMRQLVRAITLSLGCGISNNLAQMFNIMRWCVARKNVVARLKVKVLLCQTILFISAFFTRETMSAVVKHLSSWQQTINKSWLNRIMLPD
jgi:hypothetical protein